MLRRTWLVFSQAVTVALGGLFVVTTLKPQWLPGPSAVLPPATIIEAPAPVAGAATAEDDGRYGSLPLWCLLVFLSGYVIVALEIVWVRMLGQVGQYHAYLFPTVLGVFLLADGAGMALAARMVRRMEDPRPAFFSEKRYEKDVRFAFQNRNKRGIALDFRSRLAALPVRLPEYPLSNAVTPVILDDCDARRLIDGLESGYGIVINPCGGAHAHDMVRIAHVGNHSTGENPGLVQAISEVLSAS